MIFRSHCPDTANPDMALTPFVLRRANQLGGKPALIDGSSGRAISYSQLAQRVRHTAKSLTQRGYRKGDVFAIHSPNLPEYAVAFHAIATIGGVVTMADPLCAADELAAQLNDAGAKCLITTSQLLNVASAAMEGSNLCEVFTFDHGDGASPFAELFESVMTPSEVPTNALIDPRNDPVTLFFSNGGSGKGSGLTITHRSLIGELCRSEAASEIDENDVVVGAAPLFHFDGMFELMMRALWRGATVALLPTFELEQFLRTVEVYGATQACLTPPMTQALTRRAAVDCFDLSSLKLITAEAARLKRFRSECSSREL
ncbi:MAG: Long-chain-fatty-acid--CoA ligase [Acidobacteria bacterium]|nr:Long-chain-fatty-acid--CoA ligase [Acidobacteriota bacterium]